MASKNTIQVRMYKDDVDEIRLRYPRVRMADYLHTSIRSNPFAQYDAFIKKIKGKR